MGQEGTKAKRRLALEYDAGLKRIDVSDEDGRPLAGARAVSPEESGGMWWSTICGADGTPRDVKHRSRDGAFTAMLEAVTGLAQDAAARAPEPGAE